MLNEIKMAYELWRVCMKFTEMIYRYRMDGSLGDLHFETFEM